MFPTTKKKPAPFGKPKPPMDDLESPDPVEGKIPEDHAEEAAESPDEESSEDYGAKLVADIEAAGKTLGMDAATSRQAAGAFFKAAGSCLTGDGGTTEDATIPMEGSDGGEPY